MAQWSVAHDRQKTGRESRTVLLKLASGGMIRDSGQAIRFSAHDKSAKAAALLYAQVRWGKSVKLEGNQIRRASPEQAVHVAPRAMQLPQDGGRSR